MKAFIVYVCGHKLHKSCIKELQAISREKLASYTKTEEIDLEQAAVDINVEDEEFEYI
jgi:ribosomal protein S8